MKILLTGAHFTPAVATIEELKKYPDVEIVYVGRRTTQEGDPTPSLESQILPKLGVKFIPIITGRLQREFTIYTIPSLLKIPIGLMQAFWIIITQRPKAVLSFGGYVAVPIVLVSWLFSIPIIIHEQTLVSGLANLISSNFADKIALSFEQKTKDPKVLITGNPIRKMIRDIKRRPGKKKEPFILITGGNQGSHTINLAIAEILPQLLKKAFVIHISGDNKFKDFEKLKEFGEFGGKYRVEKWIGQEYGAVLQKIDLVVCRGGINTLSELAFLAKPALVIPLPYLYQDEQNQNAEFFEKIGLVRILPQSKLSPANLLKNIEGMLNDLDYLNKQAKKATKIIRQDAAKALALETLLLAKGH